MRAVDEAVAGRRVVLDEVLLERRGRFLADKLVWRYTLILINGAENFVAEDGVVLSKPRVRRRLFLNNEALSLADGLS